MTFGVYYRDHAKWTDFADKFMREHIGSEYHIHTKKITVGTDSYHASSNVPSMASMQFDGIILLDIIDSIGEYTWLMSRVRR